MEPPKRRITKILESAFLLALSAFLVRTAVSWILDVWPILLTIVLIAAAIFILYRIWRHGHDLGKW